MEIAFIYVGKTAFPDIESALKRYIGKISRFSPVSIHIVKEEKISKDRSIDDVLEREAKRILDVIKKGGLVVSWDSRGKQISSEEYAKLLGKWESSGVDRVWMIVGGPLGLSDRIIEKSHFVLSLSLMTFPHDLVRVIIAEQTYRAISINKGLPYHK